MRRTHVSRLAACECGRVVFEAAGPPIMAVACDCASCREAGRLIEALPGAARVIDEDGGTGFLLYRKDRVRCTRGGNLLEDHRLKPDSSTRRVVATCCQSAMFLEFTKGHWLSMNRGRFTDAPPVEMRTMSRDRPDGAPPAAGVPAHASHSAGFMWRLFKAWAAMGFRVPKVIAGTEVAA